MVRVAGLPTRGVSRRVGYPPVRLSVGQQENRMQEQQDTVIAALMEQLIKEGPEGMAQAFTALFELAMRLERERYLDAGLYERRPERRGYANGYKPKSLDTPAGTLTVQVPKTRGTEEPFYPQSLERGRRSCRAVMLAIAEMYIQGVSTRDAAKVMAEFGLQNLSSTQVSRAAALLDTELQAWRTRPLGEARYLLLDARYEKLRDGGVGGPGCRRALGHWRRARWRSSHPRRLRRAVRSRGPLACLPRQPCRARPARGAVHRQR